MSHFEKIKKEGSEGEISPTAELLTSLRSKIAEIKQKNGGKLPDELRYWEQQIEVYAIPLTELYPDPNKVHYYHFPQIEKMLRLAGWRQP